MLSTTGVPANDKQAKAFLLKGIAWSKYSSPVSFFAFIWEQNPFRFQRVSEGHLVNLGSRQGCAKIISGKKKSSFLPQMKV